MQSNLDILTRPSNSLVSPMLTDMYQISMAYAYWINGKQNDQAVFDVFFRRNPFAGEYCIFAGQDEVIKYLHNYRFTEDDIQYLRKILPHAKEGFFEWVGNIDCKDVKVYAMKDGGVVFPREPLLRIEGPLGITQLLETTILNLINFPSLVATNAARMRIAAGPQKQLLEFGLRRAQGPDGGVTASKYAVLGGFDATSNLVAGKLFDIPVKGTHAHSFVMSFVSLQDLCSSKIALPVPRQQQGGSVVDEVEFVGLVLSYRKTLGYEDSHEGELAAFISYAQAFPHGFLALIDTYDTLHSGVKNFICVAWALAEIGYKPLGIRLDSGDLAYLSRTIREQFELIDRKHIVPHAAPIFQHCVIVASNDINEDVLIALNREGHAIDVFGIGTHLVTCQKQPALGCVYKLVELNGKSRIKLSQESEKIVIPGKKRAFRLYGSDNVPLVDLLQTNGEECPQVGKRILVRHPFHENKRAYVTPTRVEELLTLLYDGQSSKEIHETQILNWKLTEARAHCREELTCLREDHKRSLNPTPYKISVSQQLYEYMHDLWMSELPIAELS